MIANFLMTILWLSVWMVLTWPPDDRQIIIGIFAAGFVTFMTHDLLKSPGGSRNPLRYFWLLYYIAVFIWECVKANIDVAYRVIHPDIPIRPGTLKVKTRLKSDTGLTFLASSITLTPGTTTVDIDKENGYIYIHCLYIKEGYDVSAMRMRVVEKFEPILMRIFG